MKDIELLGIYVKRCKCGNRSYYDRIYPGPPLRSCWLKCDNCGRVGNTALSKEEAIFNWNNNKLNYETI